MFARFISTHMKPGGFDKATRLFEKEVIPLLKKQVGFKDELSFYDEDRMEGIAISFWEDEEAALKYDREVYPKVKKFLADTFDTVPQLKTFTVANSTWYNINV